MAAQPCMKDSFTNRPKYHNFVALRTIVDAHDDGDVDPMIVDYLFAVSARDQEFCMTKCMSYQEGEIDSPFSLRNQGAYCVSMCEVQILMQHRSYPIIFVLFCSFVMLCFVLVPFLAICFCP